MDINQKEILMKCLEKICDYISDQTSLVLAKHKAMRDFNLNPKDMVTLHATPEYQVVKKQYLRRHRDNQSWTHKTING